MRLFLIRHGETVDNVAQVYAGSRDSELTNHGWQQATRLGVFFRTRGVAFTHIFASPLQRAYKTAQMIRDAQASSEEDWSQKSLPVITTLSVLKERDFGFYEGKSFCERRDASNKAGKSAHRHVHERDPKFAEVELKEAMAGRADTFLDEHMVPLWRSSVERDVHVVAIVSHGIILSVLWRRILRRLPQHSICFHPELMAANRPVLLEHFGGFSNTGYLECVMVLKDKADAQDVPSGPETVVNAQIAIGKLHVPGIQGTGTFEITSPFDVSQVPVSSTATETENVPITTSWIAGVGPNVMHGWITTVKVINGKEHLRGLKRTGGGVGSSKHDESQRTLESFFKRRKVG